MEVFSRTQTLPYLLSTETSSKHVVPERIFGSEKFPTKKKLSKHQIIVCLMVRQTSVTHTRPNGKTSTRPDVLNRLFISQKKYGQ